jgi:hypothetical protein
LIDEGLNKGLDQDRASVALCVSDALGGCSKLEQIHGVVMAVNAQQACNYQYKRGRHEICIYISGATGAGLGRNARAWIRQPNKSLIFTRPRSSRQEPGE